MIFFINAIAIAASIATGLVLIVYLIRIIAIMRKIATTLATVRLLLRSVASQTEAVPRFVAGIQSNVADLDDAVDQLAAGVGASHKAMA